MLGFSRQEHWSGLPLPSPMHESESEVAHSDSSRPHGLQPTRLLCPWDFPGKSTGVGCHCLLRIKISILPKLILCLCMLSHVQLFASPMDCSPPGPSVHGIVQARIPEWLPFPSPGDLPDPGMKPASCVSCIGRWVLYQLSHGGSQLILSFHALSNKILPIKILCRYRNYSKIYIERQTN